MKNSNSEEIKLEQMVICKNKNDAKWFFVKVKITQWYKNYDKL